MFEEGLIPPEDYVTGYNACCFGSCAPTTYSDPELARINFSDCVIMSVILSILCLFASLGITDYCGLDDGLAVVVSIVGSCFGIPMLHLTCYAITCAEPGTMCRRISNNTSCYLYIGCWIFIILSYIIGSYVVGSAVSPEVALLPKSILNIITGIVIIICVMACCFIIFLFYDDIKNKRARVVIADAPLEAVS